AGGAEGEIGQPPIEWVGGDAQDAEAAGDVLRAGIKVGDVAAVAVVGDVEAVDPAPQGLVVADAHVHAARLAEAFVEGEEGAGILRIAAGVAEAEIDAAPAAAATAPAAPLACREAVIHPQGDVVVGLQAINDVVVVELADRARRGLGEVGEQAGRRRGDISRSDGVVAVGLAGGGVGDHHRIPLAVGDALEIAAALVDVGHERALAAQVGVMGSAEAHGDAGFALVVVDMGDLQRHGQAGRIPLVGGVGRILRGRGAVDRIRQGVELGVAEGVAQVAVGLVEAVLHLAEVEALPAAASAAEAAASTAEAAGTAAPAAKTAGAAASAAGTARAARTAFAPGAAAAVTQ